ncbi:MAG: hypothetical protein DCF15_10435 [Phormidesmis priestleyi]|uniref:Uncharacterized protein n=1 Tax=Phormidesmis priestleyi TaxID=268141 RepID=A0A2W4ZKP1_9CYAN|nr:MAG: hypothetical protein DCF15_10435 [Phormidesmis priestleyi]
MSDDRLSSLENRMNRVEEVLTSAGDFLLQASALAQQNTTAIDRLTQRIDRNALAIERLTDRIDSLTAASERHDRILDYLLGQQANGSN